MAGRLVVVTSAGKGNRRTTLREDLYYRLNVVPVTIPRWRNRRDDIPALVDHFFTRYATEQGITPPAISPEAMAALQSRLARQRARTCAMSSNGRHPGPARPPRRIEADMLPSRSSAAAWGRNRSTPALMGVPCAKRAKLRAGISQGPDPALFRQHLENRELHRHGALGAPSQAQAAGHGRPARGRGRRLISDGQGQLRRLSELLRIFRFAATAIRRVIETGPNGFIGTTELRTSQIATPQRARQYERSRE
jgi:hypothetical protein